LSCFPHTSFFPLIEEKYIIHFFLPFDVVTKSSFHISDFYVIIFFPIYDYFLVLNT
jgi:hypothetical protein